MDHEFVWNIGALIQDESTSPPSVKAVSLSGSDRWCAHRVMQPAYNRSCSMARLMACTPQALVVMRSLEGIHAFELPISRSKLLIQLEVRRSWI